MLLDYQEAIILICFSVISINFPLLLNFNFPLIYAIINKVPMDD